MKPEETIFEEQAAMHFTFTERNNEIPIDENVQPEQEIEDIKETNFEEDVIEK
jgi:hypothetical protein